MPACSKAKNPRGIEITFTENDHRYVSVINGKEVDYTSGTTFIGKFFKPFDPTGKITERCAAKEGISVAEIKARWAAKGKQSTRLGTRMHEMCEDTILDREYRNVAEDELEAQRFKNAIDMSLKLKQRLDILGVEKLVFDERLRIAGTIDLFAKSRKDKKLYYIIDHKSNAEIEQENKFNSFCLDPISHIPDIAFWHYALQLSLYEFILKYSGYVPRDSKFKLILNHVTPMKAKLIELPNLESEIKDMVVWWMSEKLKN